MLPRERKSMVRPLKRLPDRADMSPHDEITLSSGRHLFNEIVATEKKLVDSIENSSNDKEDAAQILDCILEVSDLVSDLPLAVILPLYGALKAYAEVLENANQSISECQTMTHSDARDLHDRLTSLKSIFMGASAQSYLTESIPPGDRSISQHMFQNARDFNIHGSEFNIQYIMHNGSREESDRILRRLNIYMLAVVLF